MDGRGDAPILEIVVSDYASRDCSLIEKRAVNYEQDRWAYLQICRAP